MGYYIQGPAKGKAKFICDNYNGRFVTCGEQFSEYLYNLVHPTEAVICVVDNGPFEAAALCYSVREMLEFNGFDGRAKVWLVMPKDKAHELSGYKESRVAA